MDLETLLQACLSNDNQVRQQAEAAIKRASQQPEVIPELMTRLQASPEPLVRQLASVLLRKRIARHWQHLPAEVKKAIQDGLLQRIVQEQVHVVRRSVADVVSMVAQHTVPAGQWPQLLEFLQQCAGSPQAEHRETALTLFCSLTETIGEQLQQHVVALVAVVGRGLQDSSAEVAAAAVRAVEPLVALVSEPNEVAAFQQLLPLLLQVAERALQQADEEQAVAVWQVMVEAAESPAPLLNPHIGAMVKLAAAAAANRQLEAPTRQQALQLITWLARYKHKLLTRQKLARGLVEGVCVICMEPEPEDADDLESDLAPCMAAAHTLDTLALQLPSKEVLPAVLEFVRHTAGAGDPCQRTAAMTALAVISEGCCEGLRRRLKDVLPYVLQGLADGEGRVRGKAAFALGQMAEFLQPEITERYQEVLPLIFSVMHDPSPKVQEQACYALDTFCENLEGELVPHLPQLVGRLVEVLRTGAPPVQEMALSALSSTAAAAGEQFGPYLEVVVPILEHFMRQGSPELLLCRCRATECAGLVVGACGPAMQAAVPRLVGLALEGWSLGLPELREYTHGMMALVAKSLGAEAAPYLPQVVPLALQSCSIDDGVCELEDAAAGGSLAGAGPLGEDSEDEDLEEDELGHHLSVRTGVLDEKSAATQALGFYAEAGGAAFLPFLQPALATLIKMASYFHEQVRTMACESLQKVASMVHQAYPPPPGQAMSAEAGHVVAAVAPLLAKAAQEDEDIGVVAAGLQGIRLLLGEVGVQGLGVPVVEAVAEAAVKVLKGEAVCQEVETDDEEGAEEDEDAVQEEEDLLEAALELLPALAKAFGPATYGPVFASHHLQPVLHRMKPSQPDSVRAVVVGGLAEVVEQLGAEAAGWVDKVVPSLVRELRGSSPINKQNAAFCLGMMCGGCGQVMAQYYPTILTGLHPMFAAAEADGARDNAVGAVGRMLLAAAPSLPLEQILPVFLQALPLKEDLSESRPAYSALCSLVLGEHAGRLAGAMPAVVTAFGAVAVQEGVEEEVKVMVGKSVAELHGRYGGEMAGLLRALPADQQGALVQLGKQPGL